MSLNSVLRQLGGRVPEIMNAIDYNAMTFGGFTFPPNWQKLLFWSKSVGINGRGRQGKKAQKNSGHALLYGAKACERCESRANSVFARKKLGVAAIAAKCGLTPSQNLMQSFSCHLPQIRVYCPIKYQASKAHVCRTYFSLLRISTFYDYWNGMLFRKYHAH